MDIWTAIKNRRSIRNFTADPVEEKNLRDLILKAGIWAPSGGNAQTWRFIVITDQKILLHKMLRIQRRTTPHTAKTSMEGGKARRWDEGNNAVLNC